MIIRRVIEKEVDCCHDCPYFYTSYGQGESLESCDKLTEELGDIWDALINNEWKIDERCPFKKGNK